MGEVFSEKSPSALGEEGLQALENLVGIHAMGVGEFFNRGKPLVHVVGVVTAKRGLFFGSAQEVLVVLARGVVTRDVRDHGPDIIVLGDQARRGASVGRGAGDGGVGGRGARDSKSERAWRGGARRRRWSSFGIGSRGSDIIVGRGRGGCRRSRK